MSHIYGRSFVCDRMCLSSTLGKLNFCLQYVHCRAHCILDARFSAVDDFRLTAGLGQFLALLPRESPQSSGCDAPPLVVRRSSFSPSDDSRDVPIFRFSSSRVAAVTATAVLLVLLRTVLSLSSANSSCPCDCFMCFPYNLGTVNVLLHILHLRTRPAL